MSAGSRAHKSSRRTHRTSSHPESDSAVGKTDGFDSRFGTRNLAVLPNMRIATMGIVLFILLPALSVLLMLLVFVREGNSRLAITAGFVLAVILFGAVLGFRAMSGLGP
jgi:hypothetical protein